ncbi:MAG: hypothetical protein LIR46_00170 [Bacteroidota bacterium]|nr:hypothetical protein [Bacteroidota bacterium]
MSKLVWDQIGEKLWETGVDMCVLFPINAQGTHENGVAWSGITAINESPSGAEPTKIYADNIVYGVVMSPEEDALTIEAFTYPDEYAECIGEAIVGNGGAIIKQQTHKHFGLAYRTMIGNDTEGTNHGYKIHIFWDCVAGASEDSNSTINDSPEQKTFSWSVTTLPVAASGFQPTASMVIDSTKLAEGKLTQIKNLLYGTDAEGQTAGTESTLPSFDTLKGILTAA